MAKGGEFEREVCKELSLWWTQDRKHPSDDIFWRTSQSGGRATTRAKKRKKTHGQCGDVGATHPSGEILLDVVTISLKRGYSKFTLADLLDRPRKAAQQAYEAWIQQAVEDYERSGAYSWMIITRRDKRDAVVILDALFVDLLKQEGCFKSKPHPFMTLVSRVRFKYKISSSRYEHKIFPIRLSVMRYDDFLACVTPSVIKRLSEEI